VYILEAVYVKVAALAV